MVEANPVNETRNDFGESVAIEDPNVFAAQENKDDLFSDESAIYFSVRDPQDFHGHIVYNVCGKDLQGQFECKRRYNEFFLLQDALQKRWPGIVLPQCPPKKAMGNKDSVFLQERRFYLERFLRKIARHDFIVNSQEFQLFARPQGLDVEKSLNKLPKLSSSQLYDRLKEATMTDDSGLTDQDRDFLDVQLTEFSVYIKKADPFLRKMKEDMASYLSKKQGVLQAYTGFANSFSEYEENNTRFYCDMDPSGTIMQNSELGDIAGTMRTTTDNLRNPFTDLYHWCKGEIYDLTAFTAAVKEYTGVQAASKEAQKKLLNTKADIENVTQGKKTMNTLFKNTNDVGTMQSNVERYEREIEALGKLLDVMRIYLGRTILPQFKQEKLVLYSRIVQQFHVVEISNSHQLALFWSTLLKTPKVQSANQVVVV